MQNKAWKTPNNKPFLLSLLFLTAVACGPKKYVAEEGLTASNAKAAIALYEKQSPNFKTLSGKIRASYQDKDIAQSVNITYRIEKDKTIWMSAKALGLVTVAKVKITPNRVQFYEKINNQYFDGDFTLISQLLGVEIDFESLQNLLFGRSIYPLKATASQASLLDEKLLFTRAINGFLEYQAIIDTRDFTLHEQGVKHNNQEDFLRIQYPQFQRLKKAAFPKEITILAQQNNELVNLNLEYRDIKVDEKVSFPFEIPSNYQEIVF